MLMLTLVFFLFGVVESKEKVNCAQYVVVDKVVDKDDRRYIIFKNEQQGVKSENVTIEEFYSHEVGDEVEACLVRGKYTKFFGYWRIEE